MITVSEKKEKRGKLQSIGLWSVLSVVLLFTHPVLADPDEKKLPPFSDQATAEAIAKGVAFLWKMQRDDGTWPVVNEKEMKDNHVGMTALATYALLNTGVSPKDPRIIKALSWLAEQKTLKTYSIGFRASAFAEAVSKGGTTWCKALQNDLNALLKMQKNGMYPYA